MSKTSKYEEMALDEFFRQSTEAGIKFEKIQDLIRIDDRWAETMDYKIENLNIGKTLCNMAIQICQLNEEVKSLRQMLLSVSKNNLKCSCKESSTVLVHNQPKEEKK